jgi:acetylornithine deacetylase/succinyl-diaminopimelate desuccinylase-like protein
MSSNLIRRRPKLARALLYGIPLLLVAATMVSIRHYEDLGFKDWTRERWLEVEEIGLLQRYLQIDTSYPDGDELPGAEFLAGVLAENGIEARIERIGKRNASLIATLEGKEKEALVLHHHIDVLLVEDPGGKTPRHPPFGGVIEPPFIYGRGAFDMKSYGIAQLMAMLELKRSGRPLGRTLTLLATGDEERHGRLGMRFLLGEHPEWKQQFWGVLTEGGAIEATDLEKARYWGTEFAQKMLVKIKVCDRNRGRLEDLVERLAARPKVRRVMPEMIPFLERYGRSRDRPETRQLLADPATLVERLRRHPRDVDVTVLPPYIEAMVADEIEMSPPVPDPEGDQPWAVFIAFWILPGRSLEEAWPELVGDTLDGYDYTVDQWYPRAVPSPLDHPLYTRLEAFMKERHPEVEHGPLFIPWSASESRYFRLAGIPSYGFTPFWILSGDAFSMKGINERLPLPAFVRGVELYRDLVARLVEAEEPGLFD